MVCVNCGALPANLVESELFGHEKGAFTGAHEQKRGRFEMADGGTLFLDEVGELPPDTQTKLLRVLQEHEVQRVGGSEPISVDVRLIAATNRNLATEVKSGRFRPDLYFRLNVFPIRIPPLRERTEDIPLLAEYFVNRHAEAMGKQIRRIGSNAMDQLVRHHWPGNVRELGNVLERAVILCQGDSILADHIAGLGTGDDGEEREFLTLTDLERRHISRALEHACGVVSGAGGAAALLNVNRSTLNARMRKLGIRPSRKPPYFVHI
jgi:transcriptional regulator with GAF, ATPase, and Fis domain